MTNGDEMAGGPIPKEWYYSTGLVMVEDMPDAKSWYHWFVNSYLPEMGSEHMGAFITYGFRPLHYILWRYAQDHDDAFARAIQDKLDQIKEEQ